MQGGTIKVIKYCFKNLLMAVVVVGLLAIAMPALADLMTFYFIDDNGLTTDYVIDAGSTDAELAMIATFILQGKITKIDNLLGEPGAESDLEAIKTKIKDAAAKVAGGDAQNIANAVAAIESAISDEPGTIVTDIPAATNVTINNPAPKVPTPNDYAADPLAAERDGVLDTTGGNQPGDQGGTPNAPPTAPPVTNKLGNPIEASNPGLN